MNSESSPPPGRLRSGPSHLVGRGARALVFASRSLVGAHDDGASFGERRFLLTASSSYLVASGAGRASRPRVGLDLKFAAGPKGRGPQRNRWREANRSKGAEKIRPSLGEATFSFCPRIGRRACAAAGAQSHECKAKRTPRSQSARRRRRQSSELHAPLRCAQSIQRKARHSFVKLHEPVRCADSIQRTARHSAAEDLNGTGGVKAPAPQPPSRKNRRDPLTGLSVNLTWIL